MDSCSLHVFVDADPLGGVVVTVMRGHKVSIVFFLPSSVTGSSAGNHQTESSLLDEANGTGHFSVVVSLDVVNTISGYFVLGLV